MLASLRRIGRDLNGQAVETQIVDGIVAYTEEIDFEIGNPGALIRLVHRIW